jgi:uncharacterized protein YqjF (DUF2071 family)
MTNHGILHTTDHRPYALSKGPWLVKQVWHDLLFAHWPVSLDEIKPLIPKGLELELWEGKPWISIVPFHMSGIRLRGLPPLPFISSFPELNVRTYVIYEGKPGVYFFSLDATNRLAIETARTWFHLPYMRARIFVKRAADYIQYYSERKDRRGRSAIFSGSYRAIDSKVFNAEPGTLLHWLTERYCLYTSNPNGEIMVGDIHHLPWDLQEAELHSEVNSMAESHGITLPEIAPLLTFTKVGSADLADKKSLRVSLLSCKGRFHVRDPKKYLFSCMGRNRRYILHFCP